MSSSSGAALSRTLTKVLRRKGIDEGIKCTSTLVANYNAAEDANGREALRKWLEAYFDEFSQLRTGSIPRKTIAEFVNLAEIEVRESADAEVVRRVYTTLSEVVMTKEGCSVYFVLALEHVLSIIDNEILQQDARTLIALADRLTDMTNPKKMPLTRDTFEYQASCLHAFERVLMVLHDLEKDRSDNHIVKYFEDKTKRHLDMIISCQQYYPFSYQALLIKEHLNAFVKRDIKSNLINAGRRAFYAFCGGLYIFQGVRELAVMKLDFNVMVSGLEKIQQAFKDIGWDILPGVQEIVLAASETVEHDDFRIFQQCYDKFKKVTWLEGLKWNKQRAIRYALVSHLCLFCTKKHSASIQAPALDLLVKLVSKDEGKQWRNDQQIFEALIDALIAIGKHNEDYEEDVINAFNTILSVQTAQQKKIIEKCLNGMSFEERIKSGYKSEDDDTSRSLFFSTRQRLRLHRTPSIHNRNHQTLKDYYKADTFAKVSLFSDKNDQRHIETFDFNLEQYEKVVVSRDRVDQSSKDNYNQREDNLQRTMKVRRPINTEDLFRAHGTSAHHSKENAQRILVIGNPGTGKTCLSKRLCYEWGTGSWGKKFTHVYRLPIRRLSETSFGADVDLPLIIRQEIYRISGTQDCNKALFDEINDNLSEETTLLILDGYDEAGKMAMDLVTSAFTLNCNILILSRPHSVNDIRQRIDIEVECLEFSDANLEKFIRKELGSENGESLLEFLNGNFSIKDTCRVAVNAQIVTRLWRKASSRTELIKANSANLSRLYSMMSNFIWRRFTEEREDKFNRDSTYHSLECIAFESFRKNLVEIPEELVMDHAPETEKVFRNSGFLLFMEEGSVFQFAHLTFHEYFAGRHLAKLLMSINDEERQEAVNFIIEHRYIETSRVMLSFMTQQFCMRKDIRKTLEAFKDLMQVLESDPLPTISLQHSLLRTRTLDAFLPCGLDETEVHTNDDVMHIVNDAMDALKDWFGYEVDRDHSRWRFLMKEKKLQTQIIDELERMPNLFYRLPDLLKPILLNDLAKSKWGDKYRLDIARIGKLNPQYARQCIIPLLDNWTMEERAYMIQLCTLIGPMCAEPALDHLKKLLEDQDDYIRPLATKSLVKFLEFFPKREDVRQLVVNASRHRNEDVHYRLVMELGFLTFTPEDEAGTFVWDLLNEAMKDDDGEVRGAALKSCVRLYQTCGKSVDEAMEFIREFIASSDEYDRIFASSAIEDLTQKAPEKEEELLALMKAICRDFSACVRYTTVQSLERTIKRSCLKREVLFNVAFDVFKDEYPEVQCKLLPFLFSFDKKDEDGINEVNEWIANCQDLRGAVREKANSCREANALLSKYTIEEIHGKFYDQDKKVQMEVVAQIDLREIEGNKMADAIAEMAVHCVPYDKDFGPCRSLLGRFSKTGLFPRVVLEKLAQGSRWWLKSYVKPQPLSHLLEYYWSTKDANMIEYIAYKLLLSSAIFEKKGETEMEVTFREKGAKVEQSAPFELVQELLSRCNARLKKNYGLDFLHDDAFYSDVESASDEEFDSCEESESD